VVIINVVLNGDDYGSTPATVIGKELESLDVKNNLQIRLN
jgi:hypothetical protein